MRMYEELCNKYRIQQLIGNGTYGAVFLATETRCERAVAIKAFHKDRYDPSTRRYLESEIRTMGRLWGHPNIVAIHTLEPGEDPYLAFLVMEYVDGPNLRSLIDRGPISLETVLRIGIDVCRALSYAHQKNIIHRDIKPQNILLTKELTAKLSDFGVARVLERRESSISVAGTRKYMAPEQYTGDYDYRADLYATGLVLYEMLVRHLPFKGETSRDIEIEKRSRDPVIPDSVHPGMRPILRRALMRDPNRRYQTADELRRDLEGLRRQLYREYVLQVMERHQGASTLEGVLKARRGQWGLLPSEAALIELEVARTLEEKQQRSQRTSLGQQTIAHYKYAREYLNHQDRRSALSELQNLVMLHLNDDRTARLIADLFARLIEQDPSEKASDPEWLFEQITHLPDRHRRQLLQWLEGSPDAPSSIPAAPTSPGPGDLTTPPPPQRIPELDECERQARYFQRRVEECKRMGNLRHARNLLRKVGRLYWKTAERLAREQLFTPIPMCYMRAARAYSEAASLGAWWSQRKSRRCYLQSAKSYIRLADEEYHQQNWLNAGEHYRRASRAYELADKRSASDAANRQAMWAYYQGAQELARLAHPPLEQLERARDACQTAVTIAYQLRTDEEPAPQAKALLASIESRIEALNAGYSRRSSRFVSRFGGN